MGQFYGRREWSRDEDTLLKSLIDSGVPHSRLADHFSDRTRYAVESRAYVVRPPEEKNSDWVRRNSTTFRLATERLIAKMDPEQVAEMLGTARKPIPGTERIYKTSSTERLAA